MIRISRREKGGNLIIQGKHENKKAGWKREGRKKLK